MRTLNEATRSDLRVYIDPCIYIALFPWPSKGRELGRILKTYELPESRSAGCNRFRCSGTSHIFQFLFRARPRYIIDLAEMLPNASHSINLRGIWPCHLGSKTFESWFIAPCPSSVFMFGSTPWIDLVLRHSAHLHSRIILDVSNPFIASRFRCLSFLSTCFLRSFINQDLLQTSLLKA